MRRDPTVFVVGEDVRGGHGGKNTEENQLEGFGGVLGVTKVYGQNLVRNVLLIRQLPSLQLSVWLRVLQQQVYVLLPI